MRDSLRIIFCTVRRIPSSHRLDRSSATPVTWDRSRTFLSSGTQSEERTLSRGGRVCKYHGHIFYPLVSPYHSLSNEHTGPPAPLAYYYAFLPPYLFRCYFIPRQDTALDRRGLPRIHNHCVQTPRHSCTLITFIMTAFARDMCSSFVNILSRIATEGLCDFCGNYNDIISVKLKTMHEKESEFPFFFKIIFELELYYFGIFLFFFRYNIRFFTKLINYSI